MGSSPSPKDKPKSETETASILKHLTIHSNYSRNTIEKMEEYRTQQRVDQGDVKDVDGRVWEFLDENIDWTAVSNIACEYIYCQNLCFSLIVFLSTSTDYDQVYFSHQWNL